MTLEKARELILQQLSFGSGYNRNAVRLILGEIQRTHDQSTVDGLILELRQPPKIKIPALLVYSLRLLRCAKGYIQRVCAPWHALNTKPYPAQFWHINFFRLP